MRGNFAGFRASTAARMSSFRARANAAIGTSRTSRETAITASRSPLEAIGKPASMMSTPSAASWWAIRIFSSVFMEKPGDCSPSRSVVSKICMWLMNTPRAAHLVTHGAGSLVQFILILYFIIVPYTTLVVTAPGPGDRRPVEPPRPTLDGRLPKRGSCPMDLAELQVFLTVAKEGSFSRAAERLYRTQPAVSLAIRKLEDSLGQ